ncbi:MAG: hypothetical protein WC444_06045 [Candidatus Paceibacterota bacterium]
MKKIPIGIKDMNGKDISLGDLIQTKGDFKGIVTLGTYECSECEFDENCYHEYGKHYGYHLSNLTFTTSNKTYPYMTSSLAGSETWATIVAPAKDELQEELKKINDSNLSDEQKRTLRNISYGKDLFKPSE